MKNKVNKNELAVEVAKKEGGKQALSIGQIKEVIAITFRCLKKGYTGSVMINTIRYSLSRFILSLLLLLLFWVRRVCHQRLRMA